MHEATLSNADGFTAFSFGGYNIRFKAPYSLERYTDVVKWEDGYLVVKAKYRHNAEPEEEYIDLKPILDGLYIDYDSFLKPIKSVRIRLTLSLMDMPSLAMTNEYKCSILTAQRRQ